MKSNHLARLQQSKQAKQLIRNKISNCNQLLGIRKQSLSYAIETIIYNYNDFLMFSSTLSNDIRKFINDKYELQNNIPKLPNLTEDHKNRLDIVTYKFINLISSYKMVLEIIDSICKTSKKDNMDIPEYIKNFINYANGNSLFAWKNLNCDYDGILVTIRNSFCHDIITKISLVAHYGGKISKYLEFDMIRQEFPNLTIEEILDKLKENKSNKNVINLRFDGQNWKKLIDIQLYLDFSDFNPNMQNKLKNYINLKDFNVFDALYINYFNFIEEIKILQSNL